ncbi:MAG: Ubiquinone biosynthesis protein coq9, mitochondrial [Vezdaea aestivalis]|nr:MAG: Ubiquinone biosynthesis protein coq9, mitochondrial [Vezdaea aestivalis]
MASPQALLRPARRILVSKPSLLLTPRLSAFHSYDRPSPPGPYKSSERKILSAALARVPKLGFTDEALALGANDAGYVEAAVNLFPRRAFELVNFHLVRQRESLKERVDSGGLEERDGKTLGVGARVRILAWERLMANKEIIQHWQEALAIMAKPSNVPASVSELAKLSDEIWFLAGDTSVDTSWYTKRASLSAIYSATELHMTQDKSPQFAETSEFLDRRLHDVQTIGRGLADTGEWLSFTASSFLNVLRSKGMRI